MSGAGFIWLGGLGLVFAIGFGMIFSMMETIVLILNRMRLVERFADEAPIPVTEQEIFQETKEVYFVSRLGLTSMLMLAAFCVMLIVSGIYGRSDSSGVLPIWTHTGMHLLIVCLVLSPLYLFVVYAIPRLMIRQGSIESEEDLPRWIRPFLALVRNLRIISRVFYLLPFGKLFQHHELTKSDLLALVTDLEWGEEETENGEDVEYAEEDTLATMTQEEEEETDEDELIYNILDLDETLVREVMKPINSVVAVRLGRTTPRDICDLSLRTGYSRFPAYRDRIVDLIGYISIYDIVNSEDHDQPLDNFLTEAFYVPEFMKVSLLLRELQQRGLRVAIVVDEYGGCSGWVTREDVLEEIVGEIEDEFDTGVSPMEQISENEWLVNGDINIDDLSEELGIEFDENHQYDTLAGFLLSTLQRMPREKDVIDTDEAIYTIKKLEKNRIVQVNIFLKPRQEGNE